MSAASVAIVCLTLLLAFTLWLGYRVAVEWVRDVGAEVRALTKKAGQ